MTIADKIQPAPGVEAPAKVPGRTIDKLIGNTPLLRLPLITRGLPGAVELYAKAEWTNPSGSVKDRPALNIIRRAEEDGSLHPGKVLLDSSSGNMGIAYAMLGTARGYDVSLVIPGNASPERQAILRKYGVELILSDPLEGSDGAIHKVREIYEADPDRYFYADQYSNPANWQAHYDGTGVEIWKETEGRVTHFVAGLGTSGTMMGAGRRLKEENPDVKLVAFQPDSPFHGLEGLKHMPTAITPGIYDSHLADVTLEVETEHAYRMARRMVREEGLLVGISSGAALCAALEVANDLVEGVVVTVFPDNGYKYLTEKFWEEGD